jgi:signal transduction histidine kinase
LLDDAIGMNSSSYAEEGIVIERAYGKTLPVTCDRHKAYQIVMNFLTNARDAIAGNARGDRRIVVRTRMISETQAALEVADNGIGIAPENLNMIFSHGFTTKETGHGFGLHSSACCALEMNGAVSVESPGVGEGATFRLTMPVAPALAKAG